MPSTWLGNWYNHFGKWTESVKAEHFHVSDPKIPFLGMEFAQRKRISIYSKNRVPES